MKEIKKGDTVYYGTLKGKVTNEIPDVDGEYIRIDFENGTVLCSTIDGRWSRDTPVVLSHFPYEIEMKQVDPVIEKDTLVWFKDGKNDIWNIGYYSHFENGKHFIFGCQKKSKDNVSAIDWKIVTTENPLI